MDFKVIIDELFNTDLYINILFSLKNVIFGFSIAFITSICLAILLNQCKIIDKIVYPVIEFLRPIPNAGWVPVAIIICSTIEESILFITFIGAFFPMFINIYRALKEIPKNYINISKLYKVNIKDKIFKILLPAILPNIFTASMLGISGAWLSVIMAEMISGKMGLGYYTWKSYTLLCYEKLLIGIVFMGLFGSLFSVIISFIAKKCLFWIKEGD